VLEAEELRAEHPGCGVEKMYDTLLPPFIGRDRFVDIFMDLGFRVKYPKNHTRTTFSVNYNYPDLIEGMLVSNINQVVQSDITYFLLKDTFYYIVFIIDVFSKRIVGSKVSNHLRAIANLQALKQLIKLRGFNNLFGLIHHSDRGTQYGSNLYINTLKQAGIHISMCLNAQENAYAERVNGIIKNEYLKLWKINSFYGLKRKLSQAVNHYNFKRPHRHLPNKMSPVQFENAFANANYDKEHFELIFAKENFIKRNLQKQYLPFFNNLFQNANGLFCPILLN